MGRKLEPKKQEWETTLQRGPYLYAPPLIWDNWIWCMKAGDRVRVTVEKLEGKK